MITKNKLTKLEERLEKQKKCKYVFIRTEEETDRFFKYIETHDKVDFKGILSKKMEAYWRGIDVHELDGTCFDKKDF